MKKHTLLSIGLIFIMLTLLCYPNLCLHAAQEGLLLWFNKVLPSLLPFMILINLLIPLNGLTQLLSHCSFITNRLWHLPGESLFAFVIGLIAGYPMGAKVIKSLYLAHQITQSEAEILLTFCNNCGPLFIISTVGTAMLGQTHLGYFLFLIHFLSACLMSFFMTHRTTHSRLYVQTQTQDFPKKPIISKLLNESIIQAMDTIVCVGGYIILFSVLTSLLTQSPLPHYLLIELLGVSNDTHQLISGILSGILELSNGTYALSKLSHSTYILALISGVIGFGGICVYFQSLFVLNETPFYTTPLLIAKGIQGILSISLTLFLYPLYELLHTDTLSLYTLNTWISWIGPKWLLSVLLFTLCMLGIILSFKDSSPSHFSSLYTYKKKPE